ncbi:MAG: DnaA regulatory inactivator Hda [Proteobacteria bacterium]|nr:DnaA regulatory inactivator Hda [Pseudomonadota bacterium]
MQQLPLGVRLADHAVFASFLAAANGQALAGAQQLARGEPGPPLWLCGPPAAGKTHLLQAICAAASPRRAVFLPMKEMAALGAGVLEGLRDFACVCLDDVDGVIGRMEWERALLALLHDLQDSGARLAMSAAAPPAVAQWLLPDLGSRCAAAAVHVLKALDERQQIEALQLRARLRGVELPRQTALWLQRRFARDMHSQYALLDTLDTAALVAQRRLTVPFIRAVLNRGAGPGSPPAGPEPGPAPAREP